MKLDIYLMRIKITQPIKDSINKLGNKTAKKSGLKVYCALLICAKRKNKQGFFDCPSDYFVKINNRYSKVFKQFLQDGIIEYHTNLQIDPEDIFRTKVTKNYSPDLGYCMKYKFLVDIEAGEEIEVDFKTNREYRWYSIIENSLNKLGYTSDIKRDSFGRRVHYSVMYDYKTELAGKGLYVIDSVCSQPRLLWLIMKKKGIIDPVYDNIFENDYDFYNHLVCELNLKDRQEAKDLFMFWINSSGYVPNYGINKLFPITSSFIKGLQSRFYKDSSAYLQRQEAKIWIDDLLENLPVNFALPIHDSLIIRREDFNEVLQYCKTKYPELRFSSKEL